MAPGKTGRRVAVEHLVNLPDAESGSSRLAYVFVQILAISVHAVDGQQHSTTTQPEKGFTNTESVHREVAIILLAANVIH